MSDGITRPGYLYYVDGVPGWTIRVPQPSRFKDVDTSLEFRLFRLPQGGLLACIFRLYDIPDQPFYVHRVFDLSDPEVRRYLDASKEELQWIVEIKSSGEDRDCVRVIPLGGSGFTEGFDGAVEHNEGLGKKLDGGRALKKFLEVFEPAAREGGWEGGWDAVAAKYEEPE